jgi:hypothetical protein
MGYFKTLSVADITWRTIGELLVNSEWKVMWKEAIFVSFDILFRHLPLETEENHEHLEDNPCDEGIRIEHLEIKSVPA